MLNLVEIRTVQGALLSLPLDDASSGLIIANVDGLDPVKANIVSSSFANQDGTQYQSSKREARNLLVKIDLEPDYVNVSARTLRNRLYGFLMPKSQVDLRFYDSDGLTVDISGRVESFDCPLFTQEPQATASIICFKPDFLGLNPVEVPGMTVSNEVMTTITYDGSVETGIKLTLNPDRALNDFTVYHQPPDGTLRTLEFSGPLSAGDVLNISTVKGAKGATLTSSGSDSSVLYAISPQSNWIELQPGDNLIRVYAEGAAIPFNIEYVERYGGL